jgi:pimeloyl-ACP methyl ester carboxylesterase
MKVPKKGTLTAGVLVGTLLVASGLSVSSYRGEIRAIRESIDSLGSQILETECGTVEYARVGSGYPVLVIHGNAGGFDQGLGLGQGYLDPSFQVIAPSRFGYLRSPVPEGATPALQADAYACLLDALGIEQVAILTSSAGVTSSIQFALRYPKRVSAIVLHSPNAPGKEGLVPPPKAVFRLMLASDYVWWALNTYFGSRMQSFVGVPRGFSVTDEYEAEVRAALVGALPVSARADGMIFDTYVSNPAINEYPLGEIHTPTLVISAVDDPMALHENARTLADQIPNAHLMAVSDGGHLLLGHSEEVRLEVTRFLRNQVSLLQNSKQNE